MNHLLSITQFDAAKIKALIDQARKFKEQTLSHHLQPAIKKKVVNFFCEPSTRTRISFDAAAQNLGLGVLTIADKEGSSINKGETLEDSIRVLSRYANCIVLRHGAEGAADVAAKVSSVPIINAGDGINEHPTQALLDLFTISEKKPLEDLKVLIVGDLKYGRTVHSLILALNMFGAKVYVSSHRDLALPPNYQGIIKTESTSGSSHPSPLEVLKMVDVVYMTRHQTERLPMQSTSAACPVRITAETIKSMREDALVMHPGPRNNEIEHSDEVENDPRFIFFDQAENGLYMRMAILNEVMGLNILV